MSRAPARETIVFAVALGALAVFGGVAAATVAGATPTAHAADVADVSDAPPNATVEYDGERLVVEQATEQRISGSSTLQNGTQVTIRARSSASANPFLRSSVANVDESGSFAASFDFSSIDRGTEFEIVVYHNGTRIAEAPGVVGGCDPACGEPEGSVSLGENVYQTTAGESVAIRIDLEGRETATLRFGSEATNVRVPVTVEDGNGDGTVVVTIETAVDAPNAHGVSVRSADDDFRVHDTVDRPSVLDPGDYDVSLFERANPDLDEPSDIGTVVVLEATEDLATTRSTTERTTTVGTIYGTAATSATERSGGFSLGTLGILGVGGVLAVLGILALVGGLD